MHSKLCFKYVELGENLYGAAGQCNSNSISHTYSDKPGISAKEGKRVGIL